MTKNAVPESLRRGLLRRATRVGLHVDAQHRRYLNSYLYGANTSRPGRVLYVGVGNGFDAFLALYDGLCDEIVGIDPYIESDGSGEDDYRTLIELIDDQGFGERFAVKCQRVEDYLEAPEGKFDLIICNHVLHHIYWMEERLTDSPRLEEAQDLFRQLNQVAAADGRFVIHDTSRHGLRPLIFQSGLIRTHVDYRAKQSWTEWDRAVRAGGWAHLSLVNYVPYPLRAWKGLRTSRLARVTLCEAYVLTYGKTET